MKWTKGGGGRKEPERGTNVGRRLIKKRFRAKDWIIQDWGAGRDSFWAVGGRTAKELIHKKKGEKAGEGGDERCENFGPFGVPKC